MHVHYELAVKFKMLLDLMNIQFSHQMRFWVVFFSNESTSDAWLPYQHNAIYHLPPHRPHSRQVSVPCCSGWPAPMNTPQGQQRTAEQRWVRWLQCLIRKWSCVNHQFQFHTQIANKPTYMTHDLCDLLLFNYVPKHWGCFKWTLKIFANFDAWLKRMTCWCVISLRWCRIMAVHKS